MGEENKEKEEKSKGKGKKRLVRFLILLFAGLLIAAGVKALIGQGSQGEGKIAFQWPIKEKIEALGENALGAAVRFLPGAPDLESVGEVKSEPVNQVNQETEPIKQPAEKIQKQTEALVEMIKKLPQDQIEAVKKQLYKEFCEKLLERETEE